MAAQARTYDKNISFSSRQVDEKYLQKNRHLSEHSTSRESSPYRNKTNNIHLSPNGRKRSYDSPSSSSSRQSNSPYESSRKKEKLNNSITKSKETTLPNCDWSQHTSSSGKTYYYNRKTEESQWEVPKEWLEKLKDQQKNQYILSKDSRPKNEKPRDIIRENKSYKLPPEKSRTDRENHNSRDSREKRDDNSRSSYKDNKYNRDRSNRDNYESSLSDRDHERDRNREYNRDRERERDRDRERNRDRGYRDSKDYSDKYNSRSSKYDSRFNSPGIKSVGQSTPASKTSVKRSYRGTPEQNGIETVQDISPPGTPTNDDVMNISGISPAPLYTPHGLSPLINSSSSNTTVLQLPTTPRTPLLSSPIIINNTTGSLPAPFLHPLQQAFLLQQQVTPAPMVGSPKLPTVKNHITDTGSASPSPKLSSSFSHKSNHSPNQSKQREILNATPPPPPPPLKEQRPNTEPRERVSKSDRYSRSNSSFDSRTDHSSRSHRDDRELERSKSYDERNNDTPLRTHSRNNDAKTSEKMLLNFSQKQLQMLADDNDKLFSQLPNLDNFVSHYSPAVNDFTNGFYGNMLERQALGNWEETMQLLHSEGCRSKSNLQLTKQQSDQPYVKYDVNDKWASALDTVLNKVESLRDSSMKSETRAPRELKSSPHPSRTKSKETSSTVDKITSNNSDCEPVKENGEMLNNCTTEKNDS